MTAKASGEIQEDNRRTRVTRWRFPPHGETGFHRHELDYVIVPLTSGPLTIVDKQGQETTAELTAGVSYFREAGVEHNAINASDGAFAFVGVELQQAQRQLSAGQLIAEADEPPTHGHRPHCKRGIGGATGVEQ